MFASSSYAGSSLGHTKQSVKRRKFTNDEDQKLKELVTKLGTKSWERIARFMPDRTARQCRDRYKNYLLETLVTDPWTPEEDALVVRMFHELGPKWVEIARMLNGRSGNHVKNRWHKHLAKRGDFFVDEAPKIEGQLSTTEQQAKEKPSEKTPALLFETNARNDCDWSGVFAHIEADIAMSIYGSCFPDEMP